MSGVLGIWGSCDKCGTENTRRKDSITQQPSAAFLRLYIWTLAWHFLAVQK